MKSHTLSIAHLNDYLSAKHKAQSAFTELVKKQQENFPDKTDVFHIDSPDARNKLRQSLEIVLDHLHAKNTVWNSLVDDILQECDGKVY